MLPPRCALAHLHSSAITAGVTAAAATAVPSPATAAAAAATAKIAFLLHCVMPAVLHRLMLKRLPVHYRPYRALTRTIPTKVISDPHIS